MSTQQVKIIFWIWIHFHIPIMRCYRENIFGHYPASILYFRFELNNKKAQINLYYTESATNRRIGLMNRVRK